MFSTLQVLAIDDPSHPYGEIYQTPLSGDVGAYRAPDGAAQILTQSIFIMTFWCVDFLGLHLWSAQPSSFCMAR